MLISQRSKYKQIKEFRKLNENQTDIKEKSRAARLQSCKSQISHIDKMKSSKLSISTASSSSSSLTVSTVCIVVIVTLEILTLKVPATQQAFISSLAEQKSSSNSNKPQVPFKTSFFSSSFDNPFETRRNAAAFLTSPLANLEQTVQNSDAQYGPAAESSQLMDNSGTLLDSNSEVADHQTMSSYDEQRLSSSQSESVALGSGARDTLMVAQSQLINQTQTDQSQAKAGASNKTAAEQAINTSTSRSEPFETTTKPTTSTTTTLAVTTTTAAAQPTTTTTTTAAPITTTTKKNVEPQTSSSTSTESSTSTTVIDVITSTVAPAQTSAASISSTTPTTTITTTMPRVNSSSSNAIQFSSLSTTPKFQQINITTMATTTQATITVKTTPAPAKQQEPREAKMLKQNESQTTELQGEQLQVPVCNKASGCNNYIVSSVPVLNSEPNKLGANQSETNRAPVREFVFMPADLGPLTFDESAYPINRTNSSDSKVSDSTLPAEHRMIDGGEETDLVGSAPNTALKLNSTNDRDYLTAPSFMLVNDNGEVELDYANMDGESGDVQDRLAPTSTSTTRPPISTSTISTTSTPIAASSTSTQKSVSSTKPTATTSTSTTTTSTTLRPSTTRTTTSTLAPTTTTSTTTTTRSPSLEFAKIFNNQPRQSTTSSSWTLSELRDERQKSTTSNVRQAIQKGPTTTPASSLRFALRKNDKYLSGLQKFSAGPEERITISARPTTTTTTTTTTSRPAQTTSIVEESRANGIISRRSKSSLASNHRQFFNEPAGDWRRRRQPATNRANNNNNNNANANANANKEIYSPLNNGADEEEANILTSYLIPSQLSRLSSIERQTPTEKEAKRLSQSEKFNRIRLQGSSTKAPTVMSWPTRQSSAHSSTPVPPVVSSTSITSVQTTTKATETKPQEQAKSLGDQQQQGVDATVRSTVIKFGNEPQQFNEKRVDESNSLTLTRDRNGLEIAKEAATQTLSDATSGQLMMTLISSSIEALNQQQQQQSSKQNLNLVENKVATVDRHPSTSQFIETVSSTRPSVTSTRPTVVTTTTPTKATSAITTTQIATRLVVDQQARRSVNVTAPISTVESNDSIEEEQLTRALLEEQDEEEQAQQARRLKLKQTANSYGAGQARLTTGSSAGIKLKPEKANKLKKATKSNKADEAPMTKSDYDQTGKWQPDTNVDYSQLVDYQPKVSGASAETDLIASEYSSSALSGEPNSGLAIGQNLANSMPGRPGVDYPTHWQVPKTSFDCRNYEQSGFYADIESDCQAYHSCHRGRGGRHTFLCPNGTLFSQELLTCDWWYNVECSSSKLYTIDSDAVGSTSSTTSGAES